MTSFKIQLTEMSQKISLSLRGSAPETAKQGSRALEALCSKGFQRHQLFKIQTCSGQAQGWKNPKKRVFIRLFEPLSFSAKSKILLIFFKSLFGPGLGHKKYRFEGEIFCHKLS